MKTIFILSASLLASLSCAAAEAPSKGGHDKAVTATLLKSLSGSKAGTEKAVADIEALVADFQDAIVNKKKDKFTDLFLNQHVPWLGVFDEAAAAKISAVQPKWGKLIPYANDTYLSFIDDIASSKSRIEEKMENVKIETDGEIATVTADYTYSIDDYKQNWGKESWHLLHGEEGWKISSVIYSVTFNPEPRSPS